MFFPEGQIRVHLYGQPCDMRRSFDGLSTLVRHELQADPCDGSLYCFINRRAAFSAHLGRDFGEFAAVHQLRKARLGTPNNSRTCCCRGVRSASNV